MSRDRPRIDYYFSFISLWSYVGGLAFQDLVRRTDAEVTYRPIDLLAVFAAGGGKPVRERPAQRQAYRLVEMKRWREIRGIPLVLHPRFYPADPSLGHRMVLAALERTLDVSGFVHAGLKAVWADELDVANEATLVRLANEQGLPGEDLLGEALREPALAEQEAALTREAIDRQLFGAPFYFFRDEPFWGQDRLDLLERAIRDRTDAIPFTPVD
ncbi:2-hydroxychromene-2-carboxylate isomerase [Methylopila sp. M107]|uniref:2-hydroxychromene-2-carboxylate isomerase n=1 Tax=Methylopila sp. M107 TaxID=1101190 RepID=UPI0003767524|nr:2-hydroxychromene-2-carboxylate isomerase [Methylopila sp. M107]